MATVRSGLFTLKEFSYRRNVLKLAPDAFVVINGALTSRILSTMEVKSTQDIDVKGGITSVNVSAAVSPPGSSRATIDIVAPMYKGLHEDYYVTMPNGTRVPFFIPMMEVKIYMKGRYLESGFNYVPRYYPVFWGMITGVQENYSDGNFTLSITCEDFLCWWKYQKVTLNPSATEASFGGAPMNRFPTVFEKMSAWEIIYSLFTDSFFVNHNNNGTEAYYNFVYPKWSRSANLPSSVLPIADTFGPLSTYVMKYWNDRFGMGVPSDGNNPELIKDQLGNIPLQMFGLKGPIDFKVVRNKLLTFLDKKSKAFGEQSDSRADIDLDFGLLAQVQPYGMFDLFGQGSESNVLSKLEIATSICEKVSMEFFVDTNGMIVFKPPFYNLDVASGKVDYYRVGPEDVINYNSSIDSNSIINYLTVTGPMYQSLPSLEAIGFHADFDSIKRYGIRSETINVPYGMSGTQLKMIAVAEMAKRNGQAFTGSVSIPLRPEIRLGYPVYLEHVDTFYYVTGVNHSFSFGSAATTELSLQFKRERVFDDGNSGVRGSILGDTLYSCVLRNRETEIATLIKSATPDAAKIQEEMGVLIQQSKLIGSGEVKNSKVTTAELDLKINDMRKQILSKQTNVYDGPGLLGLWKIDRASIKARSKEQLAAAGNDTTYTSNELVMITTDTVPYTDKLGYRHIGAFPYGANLILTKDGNMRDSTSHKDFIDQGVDTMLNSVGVRDVTSSGGSSEANQATIANLTNESTVLNEDREVTLKRYQGKMDRANSIMPDVKQQQNEQANPDIYSTSKKREGLISVNDVEVDTRIQMNISINNSTQVQ